LDLTKNWLQQKRCRSLLSGCQLKEYLQGIGIPVLLVNAKNDCLLDNNCYAVEATSNNQNLFLEIPKYGGQVGFMSRNNINLYWSETRALGIFEPYV